MSYQLKIIIRSIDRFKAFFRPTLEKRYTLIWPIPYSYQTQKKLIVTYPQLRRLRAWLKPGLNQRGSKA